MRETEPQVDDQVEQQSEMWQTMRSQARETESADAEAGEAADARAFGPLFMPVSPVLHSMRVGHDTPCPNKPRCATEMCHRKAAALGLEVVSVFTDDQGGARMGVGLRSRPRLGAALRTLEVKNSEIGYVIAAQWHILAWSRRFFAIPTWQKLTILHSMK